MMDSSTCKSYDKDGFDPRQFLEHYVSDKPDMVFREDTLLFPIQNLARTFARGHIKGDVLMDLSFGSMVHFLYAACGYFKHIIILKVRDGCIMELKRWLDTRTGAFNWSHAIKMHGDIEGSSDHHEDKEKQVREAAHHIVKCNLEKENVADPLTLPLADCIISGGLLDAICKTQDDYIRHLRKFSGMLKPGGHFLLIGTFGMTYYTVGKDKLHAFNYDEALVRKCLVGEGFVIDNRVVKKRMAESDLTDYKAFMFIEAHKKM